MKLIPLTKGKEALVDGCDYAYLMRWKWFCNPYNYAIRNTRVNECEKRTVVFMHLVIAHRMGLCVVKEIDHENRNSLDNRRSNLRLATRHQQLGNMGLRKDNTSGYRGVSWNKVARKWQARIYLNNRSKSLGLYSTAKEAAEARNIAAKKHFGEFAWLNPVA
jgi:hypothetical protein